MKMNVITEIGGPVSNAVAILNFTTNAITARIVDDDLDPNDISLTIIVTDNPVIAFRDAGPKVLVVLISEEPVQVLEGVVVVSRSDFYKDILTELRRIQLS